MSFASIVRLHANDNVVVAVSEIQPGDAIDLDGDSIAAVSRIPPGHKVAVREIAVGEAVFKYGSRIGEATSVIQPGEHVHSHNL